MLKHSDWLYRTSQSTDRYNGSTSNNGPDPLPPPPPSDGASGGGGGGGGGVGVSGVRDSAVCGPCYNAYVRGLAPTTTEAAEKIRGFVNRTQSKLRYGYTCRSGREGGRGGASGRCITASRTLSHNILGIPYITLPPSLNLYTLTSPNPLDPSPNLHLVIT